MTHDSPDKHKNYVVRSRDNMYDYQKRAVEFIKERPNCALWAECGLGKTAIAETVILDLVNAFESRRALVIAPLRVARRVWTEEAREWEHLQDLGFSRIIGNRRSRRNSLIQKGDIHLINRENVKWLVDEYFDATGKQKRYWPYDVVVLDESQGFSEQSTARWKAVRKIRKLFPRLIQLTGTPTPNGYGKLWPQLFLLDRGQRLGRTEKDFRDRWFNEHQGDGYRTYKIKDGAKEEIQAAISDIVFTLRADDFFDLPPVKYNPVEVYITPQARAVYNKLAREYVYYTTSGGVVTAANAAVCSQKLLQLANGFVYTGGEETREYEVFHDAKIDALLELLEGASGPVIIAHNFIADRARIEKVLAAFCGVSKTWAYADSDADLNAFAKGLVDILLLHPARAGHGLNDLHLSGSATIIWFGLTSNLEYFQQLNARLIGGIRRLGKNVIVHLIVAEKTIDTRWWQMLTDKAAEQDNLTKCMAGITKEILCRAI